MACCTHFPAHFVTVVELFHEKVKKKSSYAACAVLYKTYRKIHVSETQATWISSKG